MKGRDVIALFEYGRAFDSQKRKPRRKRKEPVMNLDDLPADVLINKLENHKRKAKMIESWLADQGKIAKEDKGDKKEEKKGWEKFSFIQKFTVLTTFVPLAMMAYFLTIMLFVKIAARAMGI